MALGWQNFCRFCGFQDVDSSIVDYHIKYNHSELDDKIIKDELVLRG